MDPEVANSTSQSSNWIIHFRIRRSRVLDGDLVPKTLTMTGPIQPDRILLAR